MGQRRFGIWLAAIGIMNFTGCMTQQYSTPLASGEYLNKPPQYVPPDYIAFMDNDRPVAALPPAPLPPSITQTPPIVPVAGTITPLPPADATPPKRSFKQRVVNFFTSSKPMTPPIPTNTNVTHNHAPPPLPPMFPLQKELVLPIGPTPLPAKGITLDPSVASSIPDVKMPAAVTPPTPEQVKAIPADLVKTLQKGEFDPNVIVASAQTSAPKPTNPLDGTLWVRDTMGCRVTVKFTADRILAEASMSFQDTASKAPPTLCKFTMQADYIIGKNGMIHGIVTSFDSKDMELPAPMTQSIQDSPYCFRFRLDDKTLTFTDLRCGNFIGKDFGTQPEQAAHHYVGIYEKTTEADLGKRTPIKPKAPVVTPSPVKPERVHGPTISQDTRHGVREGLELVHSVMKQHPETVQMLTTEAGRRLGHWMGEKNGNAKNSEMTGAFFGAIVGEKLTRPAKPKKPDSIQALSYWLGNQGLGDRD
jgi:hypothetical protein